MGYVGIEFNICRRRIEIRTLTRICDDGLEFCFQKCGYFSNHWIKVTQLCPNQKRDTKENDLEKNSSVAVTLLGFKPTPECATLDSRVTDQGRIYDFIYWV